MAITLYNGGITNSGHGTSHTYAFDVGSGSNRLFAIFLREASGGLPSSVTYAGASTSYVGIATDNYRFFEKAAPTTGANNVVITFSAYGSCKSSPGAFDGVDQTTPTSGLTGASGGSGSPSYSQTPPTNGATFGFSYSSYTNSMTWSGTGTSIAITDVGYKEKWGIAWHTSASTFSWSTDSAWWRGGYIGLNAAAAAADVPTRPLTILDAVHRASNW